MVVAVLVLAVTLVLVVSLGAGLIRSISRAHTRERDLLLNQLLHAVGNPWQPAPADNPWSPPPVELYEAERPGWSAAPDQESVF